MIYQAEHLSFIYNQEFSFEKLVYVTAKTVALWSDNFEAEQLIPKKQTKTIRKIGSLPDKIEEKEKTIKRSLDWLFGISEYPGNTTFKYILYQTQKDSKKIYK